MKAKKERKRKNDDAGKISVFFASRRLLGLVVATEAIAIP